MNGDLEDAPVYLVSRLDGNPRVIGAAIDIRAYKHQEDADRGRGLRDPLAVGGRTRR